MDRMAADCAEELEDYNVAMVSLWPGAVKTELSSSHTAQGAEAQIRDKVWKGAETKEFVGKAVVRLAADTDIMDKTGRILLTADLCQEYGFVEEDGTVPRNLASWKTNFELADASWLASWIPASFGIPKLLLHMASYKF